MLTIAFLSLSAQQCSFRGITPLEKRIKLGENCALYSRGQEGRYCNKPVVFNLIFTKSTVGSCFYRQLVTACIFCCITCVQMLTDLYRWHHAGQQAEKTTDNKGEEDWRGCDKLLSAGDCVWLRSLRPCMCVCVCLCTHDLFISSLFYELVPK